MSYQNILAAIDQSPLSQGVFDQALHLACTNQAKLLLLHCLTTDVVAGTTALGGEFGWSNHLLSQSYQVQQVHIEQQIQTVRSLLHHYAQLATHQGVQVEVDYKSLEAGPGICQIAAQWGANLIVMGRRGRRGFSEMLLGSVSNYVLHHAACPVLVIPAETPIPTATNPPPPTHVHTHSTASTAPRAKNADF
jgi:nucleotide-binding universal stress UspA family protein